MIMAERANEYAATTTTTIMTMINSFPFGLGLIWLADGGRALSSMVSRLLVVYANSS